MKKTLIILMALFFFCCERENRILEKETYYEALENGEFVRKSNVTYNYRESQSKVNIFCRQYNDQGSLRRTILFGSVSLVLNEKINLSFDQWGQNDSSNAVVNLTTWQSDGDVYAETYNLINKNEAWIRLTKHEDDFLEGEALFTLAFDSTFAGSNGRVYPEISDTLVYEDFVFKAFLSE